MFDSLKVRHGVLFSIAFGLLIFLASFSYGARAAYPVVDLPDSSAVAYLSPAMLAVAPPFVEPTPDETIKKASDAAAATSDPGLLGVLTLITVVALFRKVGARFVPFFVTGAGAALLTIAVGFLWAVVDAGEVSSAACAAAFVAIGGAAAVYSLARALLYPLLLKLGQRAGGTWLEWPVQLALVLPVLMLQRPPGSPEADGIGTSPSFDAPVNPRNPINREDLGRARGGGIGTSPSYTGDDTPTLPGGGY